MLDSASFCDQGAGFWFWACAVGKSYAGPGLE